MVENAVLTPLEAHLLLQESNSLKTCYQHLNSRVWVGVLFLRGKSVSYMLDQDFWTGFADPFPKRR